MIRHLSVLVALLCAATAAAAQDEPAGFRLGADAFYTGRTVVHDTPDADDVFMAGERVDLVAPIAGTAHLAGRRLTAEGAVGGDVYAAGADVTLEAPVAGNATLAGYDVAVENTIGGNLRAAGGSVSVGAAVTGTALLAGGEVEIDGAIGGDVMLQADDLIFGPEATVGGRLILYAEADNAPVVPERVAPPARVEIRSPSRWEEDTERASGWVAAIGSFVLGILILAVLALLAAVLAPSAVERLREHTAERPFRTLWIGFLTLSALIGAPILISLTLVGIIVAPAIVVLAVLIGALGFVIAVYELGHLVWRTIGQLPPDTFTERASIALIGATLAAVLSLIPLLGWIALLVMVLLGIGAFAIAALRPQFLT